MNDYLTKIKEQLFCNATQEYKNTCITFHYTNEKIDSNIYYFERCKKIGLSPYKSMWFFNDYLQGEFDVSY